MGPGARDCSRLQPFQWIAVIYGASDVVAAVVVLSLSRMII